MQKNASPPAPASPRTGGSRRRSCRGASSPVGWMPREDAHAVGVDAARRALPSVRRDRHAYTASRRWPSSSPPGRPSSWRERPRAATSRSGRTRRAPTTARDAAEGAAAARLRRRGARAAGALGEVARRAARSCSRRATAPSRSTTSRAVAIREKLKILLQMAAVLTYGATLPVVKVGRIAGPVREAALVADRGRRRRRAPVVPRPHGPRRRADAPRRASPDPERMVQGYHQSAATLNLVRAFTKGGFADLTQVHAWNQEFVASSPAGPPLRAARVRDRARAPLHGRVRDRPRRRAPQLHEVDVWTSHEGLAARLRGGADAARLAHRRLVRLLGAHALDRRAHAPARTARTSSSSPACTTRSA